MYPTQTCPENHRTARQALLDLIAQVDQLSTPLEAMTGVPLYIPRPLPPQPARQPRLRRAPRSPHQPRVRRPLPSRWVGHAFPTL